MHFLEVIFIKKVVSLIMIFLVGFTTQIKEKNTKVIEPFSLAKFRDNVKVAEERCVLVENPN
ncbi:hypothetical protein AAE02nite_16120 [Adhaeribacter aerolatus]|uniref:Uncharacterized protein n=1 Tax=Adhaeribacter aerolatus TaxID=670289 RepID=A0A512AW44_9BACT|nr:hypothetical protein AAE02nite_16120 [Adhaeribacter aerolatus]